VHCQGGVQGSQLRSGYRVVLAAVGHGVYAVSQVCRRVKYRCANALAFAAIWQFDFYE
jgi:hypothetical protein